MKYRISITILLLIGSFSVLSAQADTTEYVFKKARYSYLQYHFGYSPIFFRRGQIGHGYSIQFTGVVFNDKLAIGLDFDGFVKNPPDAYYSSPYITTWMALSLSIEPLIRPRKVINFSFPIKLGYGSAQFYYHNQASSGSSIENPRFFVCNPQVMIWANLLKPLSLGAGASYRLCFGPHVYSFDTFSGVSGYVTIRFKFYTKEYMQKAMQRQEEYMKRQQQK